MKISEIIDDIRARFAHVDTCPFQGKRVFFENAGGALTLKNVVETTAHFAAIPDNQGRDNPASAALMGVIEKARRDGMDFLGASSGQVIVGESGTELLFRLIRAACMGVKGKGRVLSSTLEHPASRSAAARWSGKAGLSHIALAHDSATGTVTPAQYAPHVTPDTRVATIIHTSPVTGMAVDIAGIVRVIRAASPDCLIIVDGIQHAAHGTVGIDDLDDLGGIDGYVVSPYKMFSRHGYGLAWLSDRLFLAPHDELANDPSGRWELGTRDTGAYATFSNVVEYLDWLGGNFTTATDRPARLKAAGQAIHAHEKTLTDAMIHGIGNLPGLAVMKRVSILGGVDNPAREGLVSIMIEGMTSPELVTALRVRGILTHTRKADHYSGAVLKPLGLADCTRVSLAHYNSEAEVAAFLTAMREILE